MDQQPISQGIHSPRTNQDEYMLPYKAATQQVVQINFDPLKDWPQVQELKLPCEFRLFWVVPIESLHDIFGIMRLIKKHAAIIPISNNLDSKNHSWMKSASLINFACVWNLLHRWDNIRSTLIQYPIDAQLSKNHQRIELVAANCHSHFYNRGFLRQTLERIQESWNRLKNFL